MTNPTVWADQKRAQFITWLALWRTKVLKTIEMVYDAVIAHTFSIINRIIQMITNEFINFKTLIGSAFLFLIVADFVHKGGWGILTYVLEFFKTLSAILLSLGQVGIVAVAIVLVAYFWRNKK